MGILVHITICLYLGTAILYIGQFFDVAALEEYIVTVNFKFLRFLQDDDVGLKKIMGSKYTHKMKFLLNFCGKLLYIFDTVEHIFLQLFFVIFLNQRIKMWYTGANN